MLELVNVKKRYRKKQAVDGISLLLEKGDVLGLLGANGAGKSTTISMIATLIQPDEGDILLDGVSIVKAPKQIRKTLGYVPQDIALYETLSGLDNLKFWGRMHGLHGTELKQAMEYVASMVDLSEERLHQKVSTYSGGMKRRLNIGVALLNHPRIVLMDEPTVGLDIVSRKGIIQAIKEINASGVTIIYTGHYFEEVEEISNKIAILEQGKILAQGRIDEILHENMNLEQYYLSVIKQ